MMKYINKILLILIPLIVISCKNTIEVKRFPEINLASLPHYNLSIEKISVVNQASSSISAPYVSHLAPVTILNVAKRWVNHNFTVNHNSVDRELKITIQDATIKEKHLQVAHTLANQFGYPQNREYDARLVVIFEVYEKGDLLPKASMKIASNHTQTGSDADSPSEKEQLFYDLTKTIMIDFARLVDDNIYNYMQAYLN